jgi:hypothetical protein
MGMVGAYLGTIYIYNNTKCGYNTYYHPGKLYIILAMQQCAELSRNVEIKLYSTRNESNTLLCIYFHVILGRALWCCISESGGERL